MKIPPDSLLRRMVIRWCHAITLPGQRQQRHHWHRRHRQRHQQWLHHAHDVGTMQLANFINPAGMQAMGQNLYLETESSGTAQTGQPGVNGMGTIAQGSLESSNTNVVEEMVNMIEAQRTYEMNSKSISAVDDMLQFVINKT
jgi:flagellar basal body rod protein FlgG